MKAVILPTEISEDLKPLTTVIPEHLLPVVNKPIVEHLIELLVRNNIKEIILVVKHMPYEVERYFGKGNRWGSEISYALERKFTGISPVLSHLRSRLEEEFLCMSGNIVTNINLSQLLKAHYNDGGDLTLSRQSEGGSVGTMKRVGNGGDIERCPIFIINQRALDSILSEKTVLDKNVNTATSLKDDYVTNTYYSPYDLMTIRCMRDYWDVNQQIVDGRYEGIIIPGRQIREGVKAGWHTRINSTVTIKPPILIGSNCNIMKGAVINGPVVIGNNVVVDKGTIVEKSIILSNTYVGPNTEIKDSVVRKNNIVNIPRMVSTFVSEDFILGDIEKNILSDKGMRLINITVAFLLLVILSPVLMIKYLHHLAAPSKKILYSEKRYGRNEVSGLDGKTAPKEFYLYQFNSRFSLIKKIPGLINVLKGDMSIVGNSPLTEIEAELLKEEWERLRFNAPSGLFSIWEAEAGDDITWEEKMVMENYYTVTRTFLMDIRILLKCIIKLSLPNPGSSDS